MVSSHVTKTATAWSDVPLPPNLVTAVTFVSVPNSETAALKLRFESSS